MIYRTMIKGLLKDLKRAGEIKVSSKFDLALRSVTYFYVHYKFLDCLP